MPDDSDIDNNPELVEETFALTVEENDAGRRLDAWLAATVPDLSRSRIKALIEAGHATIGGATIVEPRKAVKPGDAVTLAVPPPTPADPAAQAIPLTVTYEDDDVIVIDKPAGMVVHPAAGNHDGTLVNALLAHCGTSLSGVGGVARPGIVHRLDKNTSGLMVAAKNDLAHRSLSAQFADHGRTGPLVRAYQALAWGAPERNRGTIDAPLGRSRANREKMAIVKGGRHAITHYEIAERFGAEPVASRLICRLETGRTHQIRVHMAAQGHPLIGDDTYGAGFRTKANTLPDPQRTAVAAMHRQALHAWQLGFAHPTTGETLLFESPYPADFRLLWESLRAL